MLVYLGTISYSVYLMHALVLHLPRPDIARPAQFALMLGAVLGLSVASYHLVEKPGQRLGRMVVARYRDRRLRTLLTSG